MSLCCLWSNRLPRLQQSLSVAAFRTARAPAKLTPKYSLLTRQLASWARPAERKDRTGRSSLKAALHTATTSAMASKLDSCTLSNYSQILIEHADFEFDVDFDAKVIKGFVLFKAKATAAGVDTFTLDTRDLTIQSVELHSDSASSPLKFEFGEKHKAYGVPLHIHLPAALHLKDEVAVAVRFETNTASSAVQFLEPSQTSGGVHPYLFTQCQAIHARAFVPCQDTPSVKFTYSAVVRAPQPLTALMSALTVDGPSQQWKTHTLGDSSGPSALFYSRQPIPIPSYLLALAVGNLEYRDLGPRSRVWSEPNMVDACAWEYADTDGFLQAGESIAGDYVWGRYDLLVLPPSFPYGGMENPCLTFMTPTTIAGDRSQVRVVAHECSHSWFGNLVTNATWTDFWLNEGWTMYLERRIIGKLYGVKSQQFNSAYGFIDLTECIEHFGSSHPFTLMVPDLSGGIDPDDVFSKIPYEKGFYFIYYLQECVDGEAAFEPFLRAYVKEFRFKTVDSNQFKQFFLDYFKDVPAVENIAWDTWFYKPGFPPIRHSFDTSLGEAALSLAEKWSKADPCPQDASPADTKDFTAEQLIAFLDKLAELTSAKPLSVEATRKMAELYGLDGMKNTEIKLSWYKICVDADDVSVYPLVAHFLKEQGRMKYLRPLYRALKAKPHGKELAVQTYQEAKSSYHPVAAKMVAADLEMTVTA